LCNPPFFKPQWRDDYQEILEDAGLAEAFAARARVPAEALFVAQNIRYARDGGAVGLILPDGLLTGARYQRFREILLAEHAVDRIIQLPRRIFKGTDAQTHILVLRKRLETPRRVPLQQLSEHGELSKPIFVSHDDAAHRMDYAFHSPKHAKAAVTLAELGATIARGSIEPVAGQSARETEFHTSSFPKGVGRWAVHLPGNELSPEKGYARQGDILVARVDRCLHQKVCFVSSGTMPLTTSVLRIQVNPTYRKLVLKALLSETGAKRLEATSRGVGARMISQRDLLHMELDVR
jgi:type I restriction enzyme M protein